MTVDDYRARLYEAYATTHAGASSESSATYAFRRDILPHLPADRGVRIVDLGCGQGQLVRHLLDAGYASVAGVDVSAEQVEIAHAAGITQVFEGDFRDVLGISSYDVATATDLLEHLTKDEVLASMDSVYSALAPGGRAIVRVPNGVSPFVGNYQFGDLTHETTFTPRSLHQLGAAVGFTTTSTYACPPVAHGLKSGLRVGVWKVASSLLKVTLAAETGALSGHIVTQNVVAVFEKAL